MNFDQSLRRSFIEAATALSFIFGAAPAAAIIMEPSAHPTLEEILSPPEPKAENGQIKDRIPEEASAIIEEKIGPHTTLKTQIVDDTAGKFILDSTLDKRDTGEHITARTSVYEGIEKLQSYNISMNILNTTAKSSLEFSLKPKKTEAEFKVRGTMSETRTDGSRFPSYQDKLDKINEENEGLTVILSSLDSNLENALNLLGYDKVGDLGGNYFYAASETHGDIFILKHETDPRAEKIKIRVMFFTPSDNEQCSLLFYAKGDSNDTNTIKTGVIKVERDCAPKDEMSRLQMARIMKAYKKLELEMPTARDSITPSDPNQVLDQKMMRQFGVLVAALNNRYEKALNTDANHVIEAKAAQKLDGLKR